MKTLLELYEIAENDGVHVSSYSLPKSESVSVWDKQGDCYIAIDPRSVKGEADEKVKLAHELGHCETGSFYNQYSCMDVIEKHENCANRWLYGALVPFEELNSAITAGIQEPWQLADRFGVPEQYIRNAIQFYTEQKGLKFSKLESPRASSVEESCYFRDKLKQTVLHITFAKPDITIDNLTEAEAQSVFEAICPKASEPIK